MAGLCDALEDRPDLVVLDLGLPDLDGRELLRMLRAVSAVPVIVATARDDEAEIVRVLDAGADDYVVKPFTRGAARRPDPGGAAPRRPAGADAHDPALVVGGLRDRPPGAGRRPWTARRSS